MISVLWDCLLVTWNPWKSHGNPKCSKTGWESAMERASGIGWKEHRYQPPDWTFCSPPLSVGPIAQAKPVYEKWNHFSLDWESFCFDQDSKIREEGRKVCSASPTLNVPQPPGGLAKPEFWTSPMFLIQPAWTYISTSFQGMLVQGLHFEDYWCNCMNVELEHQRPSPKCYRIVCVLEQTT